MDVSRRVAAGHHGLFGGATWITVNCWIEEQEAAQECLAQGQIIDYR